ncbi:hypothetical protein HDK77DRAFT_441944 [Phyllosticta capitalensis]
MDRGVGKMLGWCILFVDVNCCSNSQAVFCLTSPTARATRPICRFLPLCCFLRPSPVSEACGTEAGRCASRSGRKGGPARRTATT